MRTFADIIEQIRKLSLSEKEDLQTLLDKILIEERRKEIAENHKQSLKELKKGKLKFYSKPEDLLNTLNEE